MLTCHRVLSGRRRELDRMMDAALKKPTKSRVRRVATDEVVCQSSIYRKPFSTTAWEREKEKQVANVVS